LSDDIFTVVVKEYIWAWVRWFYMLGRIVICGGGIAGASMAAALSGMDYEVVLLEKEDEEFLGRSSGGETMRAETCRAFDRIGVLDDILHFSHSARYGDRRELHHVKVGMMGYFRYDAFAPDYPVVHTHHNYIVRGIHNYIDRVGSGNVEIRFGTEVVGVGEYRDGGREVHILERKTGMRRSLDAGLVIGADGGNSVVRRSLGIPTVETDLGISYLMFYIERLRGFEYGRFTVGPHGFIGIFPTSENMLRLAVEVKLNELNDWLKTGNEDLKARWALRDPLLNEAKLVKRGLPFHIIKRLAGSYVSEGACIIGDAAHVPPPILGMGISLALNDVLALKNALTNPQGHPFSLENLRRFERDASPYNTRWVETNHRLYNWLNEMCVDPSNFSKIALDELAGMGFERPV
jgi:2-polyprenyl-6-methoxyphenol hydroxylase-like FAD-dependent oxidoreductase